MHLTLFVDSSRCYYLVKTPDMEDHFAVICTTNHWHNSTPQALQYFTPDFPEEMKIEEEP